MWKCNGRWFSFQKMLSTSQSGVLKLKNASFSCFEVPSLVLVTFYTLFLIQSSANFKRECIFTI